MPARLPILFHRAQLKFTVALNLHILFIKLILCAIFENPRLTIVAKQVIHVRNDRT
jgi:hypothetical protein